MSQQIELGSRVRYGFRVGKVIRLDGRNAIVEDEGPKYPGDGNLPHRVPLSQLTLVPPQDGAA